MHRRRRLNPKDDAKFYIDTGGDKVGLDVKYINAFKGRGIFTSAPFDKGDFLLEYRGELINHKECQRRQSLYHDHLKVFMFEFHFNGKLWCVDAAKEDRSLGRLVNDDNVNPNAKMKYLNIQGKPHLCLFAARDISQGEEITYNYGDSDWPWRCKMITANELMESAASDEANKIETSVDGLSPTCPQHSPPKRVEKMITANELMESAASDEANKIETSVDGLSPTCPQHSPPKRVEKMITANELMESAASDEANKIETSADGLSPTCPQHSPPKRVEKMITANELMESAASDKANKIETSVDGLSPTCPQHGPPKRVEKCLKHHLVSATISSLDKCVQCVGPVSSFKWVGYECRVCSGVWHKSCLRKMTNDNQDPSQFLDQISDDDDDDDNDECVSSEEYIPDSETHDEDDDSDASIPITPSQLKAGWIKVKPVLPDVGTAHGSDKSIPVLSSSSKGCPSAAETLNSPKDLTKEKCEVELKQVNNLTMTKKNYCYVCGKPQSKISRHLKTHKTDAEIVKAFSLPEHSKERKILVEKMRNKGNFRHNTAVLKDGTGPLKVKRKPKAKALAGKFIHCMYCQGMYIRKELWRHARRCPFKPENTELNREPGRTKVLALAEAQKNAFCQQISSGVWKILSVMKQDEVASVVRNDLSIINLAQSLYNKHGQDPTKYEYIRQKLREVGRLLLCLRTDFSVHNLEEAVKPANFQRVVQAVKRVSGFDEEKHSYATPSLALKLGHTLQKICDIVHCRALMAEDEDLIKSTDMFKKLYTTKWSEVVSHGALNTLSDAKYNKPSTLPFTEDVQILHRHLENSAETAFRNLEEASTQNYAQLAKCTLAQIIVFNRRRAGEVSKMRLKSFHERDNTKLHEDVAMGLSKTEQRLCNYFSRIEIMGKRGRKVAVLLTPSMVEALSLLTSKRMDCGVCATNVFLFAIPNSMSHYRGQDCLRVHASECGAKHPEYLRSTQLRKHVATLSQVLNLKNNELDQVADFLGHDIRVHRDFYRLPVPTTQLAKISKLLLSMEKGNLSTMQGKSLDEIEVEDEIALSDAEEKDSGSESDDGCTAGRGSEGGTSEPVNAASDSTKQVHGFDDAGTVSSTVNESYPLSEGKDAGSRRGTKRAWSKCEVQAVMRHFKDHIRKGHLATKNECSHCKLVEGPVLEQRTVQNVRDFVRNRGTAEKRRSQL
ncbi:uncharacterized protein LOC119228025 isoform X2 [Pungitius pungitius]|uniref:uncharacterized protein LOC119228025 isoform X2 n=3 Tax=Pungitius pungitius TaxID=134920 RepID=UPI002E0EBBA8